MGILIVATVIPSVIGFNAAELCIMPDTVLGGAVPLHCEDDGNGNFTAPALSSCLKL